MAAIARVLVFLSCLLTISSATAGDGTRWACWYAPGSETVRCLLEQAPSTDAEARLAAYDQNADPRLPGLLRTIRGRPEALAGKHVSIPMWTPPVEMGFVQELAESVMCGGLQGSCRVNFDANTDGRAGLRAAIRVAEQLEGEELADFAGQVIDGDVIDATVAAIAEPAPQQTKRRRRAS